MLILNKFRCNTLQKYPFLQYLKKLHFHLYTACRPPLKIVCFSSPISVSYHCLDMLVGKEVLIIIFSKLFIKKDNALLNVNKNVRVRYVFSSFSWEMANKQFLQSGLIFKHDTRFNV